MTVMIITVIREVEEAKRAKLIAQRVKLPTRSVVLHYPSVSRPLLLLIYSPLTRPIC
jgi:hypothetical protein